MRVGTSPSFRDRHPSVYLLTQLVICTGANSADLSLIHLPTLLEQGSLPSEVPFNTNAEADETVYLCYSSGTTGKPKGVEVGSQSSLVVAISMYYYITYFLHIELSFLMMSFFFYFTVVFFYMSCRSFVA